MDPYRWALNRVIKDVDAYCSAREHVVKYEDPYLWAYVECRKARGFLSLGLSKFGKRNVFKNTVATCRD